MPGEEDVGFGGLRAVRDATARLPDGDPVFVSTWTWACVLCIALFAGLHDQSTVPVGQWATGLILLGLGVSNASEYPGPQTFAIPRSSWLLKRLWQQKYMLKQVAKQVSAT